jgi:glutathione S-transferase
VPLKLLGRPSSINVRKVLWTLDELGVPATLEPWGSEGLSLQDPAFLALNPHALVPVLVHDDLVLRESNTICRYLAHHFQRGDLLPPEATGRARVEQWMDWQATELNNAWRYAFMGLVRRSPAHADRDAIDASVREWTRQMARLEQTLAQTGAYVTGERFTLADILIGLSVQRWVMTPLDRPPLPAVAAYVQRLSERPGFRRHGANGMP